MGMRPSDNDIDHEIRDAEKYADTAHRALCGEAVTKWNKLMERSAARHKPDWSPMVGVAIAARFYFLDVFCPGCRQIKQVDLRKLDRHERTTLHALIRCSVVGAASRIRLSRAWCACRSKNG
jgi:hypothetical protein